MPAADRPTDLFLSRLPAFDEVLCVLFVVLEIDRVVHDVRLEASISHIPRQSPRKEGDCERPRLVR